MIFICKLHWNWLLCADGTFLACSFEDKQGECQRLSSKRFVKDPGELPESVIANTSTPAGSSSTGAGSS